ncbi:MAG: hypothetical protein F4X66_07495 [Chloroflexi bacterium]|nr:hypothetical protein [Chloroflexota bacterium]
MKHAAHMHSSESIRRRAPWRRAWLLAAALAALLLAVPAVTPPAPAAAQVTDDVLISNAVFPLGASLPTGVPRQGSITGPTRASAITTGGHPGGYELTSVTLALAARNAGETPTPDVGVWSDTEGAPGEQLFSLANPPGFAGAISTTAARYSFSAPAGTVLEPATTYWVVTHSSDFPMQVSLAPDPGKSVRSDPGWSHCDCVLTNLQRAGSLIESWLEDII